MRGLKPQVTPDLELDDQEDLTQHGAGRPLFADDMDTARRSQLAVDAARASPTTDACRNAH